MTSAAQPNLLSFFGHLHPLLVHLPIGFIVLLGVIELLAKRPRFQNLTHASGLILVLACASATFSAACGWLLARGGDYDASLINIHRWTGVAVAAVCLVTLLFYWRHWTRLYNIGLFATFGLVLVAGHYGGSLTHGRDFLTMNLPVSIRRLLGEPVPRPPVADPEHAIAFADIVEPIFAAKCVACHGPAKQQAKLRLDTIAVLRRGSDDGPVIVPGNASQSKLIAALLFPVEHKEHMPPAGKPQLSDSELTLIRWWVDTGASADKKVADLKPTARVYAALDNLFGTPQTVVPPKPLAEIKPLTAKLAGTLGILIQPIAAGEPWLDVNASLLGKKFTDTALAQLAPIASNVRWLDLGGTSVTDTGLTHVAGLSHLVRLDLHQTAVTDAGLARLSTLRDLEYLNLYDTAVSDAGLPTLRRLANLHQLYLWHTKVSAAAGKALADELEDKDRIARLERNIEHLQQEISRAQIEVNLGEDTNLTKQAASVSATAAPAKPINDNCPVTGKPIDPTKTFVYQEKLIGFCCGDCCAEFQKNPAKYLAKLNLK